MKRLLLIVAIALAFATVARVEGSTLTDGVWSYFGDPRAIYARGLTYAGWVTSKGDIQVGTIDNQSHLTAKVTLDNLGQRDDHDNPSLFFRSDGRLVAFYTSHGPPVPKGSRPYWMFYRIADRPYDISSWGPVQAISKNTARLRGYPSFGFAYPNPVRMGDRVWLFWRGNNYWPAMSFTSDFVHWSDPRTVISSVPGERPYVKVDGDGHSAYLAFTDFHPERHPSSIYFLRIDQNGDVRKASGRKVGTIDRPISYKQADRVYRYRKRFGRAWIMDVAVGTDGRPVLVYFRRDSKAGDQFRYARWNGRRWTDRKIVDAGGYPIAKKTYYQGGASLDHSDPSVVYLSRKRSHRGKFEIDIWTTPDYGQGWGTIHVTRDSTTNNWRPVAPRGAPGHMVLFFRGRYVYYQDFKTSLVLEAKQRAR